MHEMVCAAMEESWDAILGHIARFDALMCKVVAEGVESGAFRKVDPGEATRCIRTAMIRFHHPLLMSQCSRMPGPSIDEMIDFIMAALEPPVGTA
jgi:pyridoxal biosynthesis lyase PdxS